MPADYRPPIRTQEKTDPVLSNVGTTFRTPRVPRPSNDAGFQRVGPLRKRESVEDESELFDLQVVGYVDDDDDVKLEEAGRNIASGMEGSFSAPNATTAYKKSVVPGVESWARTPMGSVILSKSVGRGRVTVIGMDYFEDNADTQRILLNAVQMP